MKTNLKWLGAAAALTMSMSANANIIDLFTDPPGSTTVSDVESGATADNAKNFVESGNFPNTILGGYRDVKVDAISGTVDNNADTVYDVGDSGSVVTVANGKLTFNNDTGVIGKAIIQWDGNDNSSALTLGNFDEDIINQTGCDGGCDHFVVEVFQADQGFQFTIGLYTDATHFTEVTLVSDKVDALTVSNIPFTAFTDFCGGGPFDPGVVDVVCGAGGAADLNHISAAQLLLNVANPGQTAVDLALGSITKSVPEPTTLALMGLGLMGVGFSSRKKTHSAV